MKKYHGKTVKFWRQNAEEDYIKTPTSVLQYITVLEEYIEQLHKHVISNSVRPSNKLPDGEIVISSKALTDPNWTDGQTDY